MGIGYFYSDTAFEICSSDTCKQVLPVSHISSKYMISTDINVITLYYHSFTAYISNR